MSQNTNSWLNLPDEYINEIINDFTSYTSSGLTSPVQNSSRMAAISGSYNIATTAISNGSFTTLGPPSISISGVEPTISTDKHKVNIDDLYEDIQSIKQIMIELAKDEDLMERSTVIRDILSDWLIKGLSK
jgi:hypothetical protein